MDAEETGHFCMGNRVVRYLIGFVLLSAMPLQEGLAWGPAGHRIVGHIAEMNLDPGILKTIREKFNIKHLANVANWADAIKKSRHKPDVLHRATSPWSVATAKNPTRLLLQRLKN